MKVRTDGRSPERIRHHYEVEKELASKLRSASREQRRELYSKVYEELWKRVPDHPMLTRKEDGLAKSKTRSRTNFSAGTVSWKRAGFS
jgi:hypothetical protein